MNNETMKRSNETLPKLIRALTDEIDSSDTISRNQEHEIGKLKAMFDEYYDNGSLDNETTKQCINEFERLKMITGLDDDDLSDLKGDYLTTATYRVSITERDDDYATIFESGLTIAEVIGLIAMYEDSIRVMTIELESDDDYEN